MYDSDFIQKIINDEKAGIKNHPMTSQVWCKNAVLNKLLSDAFIQLLKNHFLYCYLSVINMVFALSIYASYLIWCNSTILVALTIWF